MRWLEFIRLRTVRAGARRIAEDLEDHAEVLRDEAGLLGARLLTAVLPEGDLTLALFWDTDRVDRRGSLAARRLMPVIRKHGLVDHTIWVESNLVRFLGSSLSELLFYSQTDNPNECKDD